MMLDVKKWLFSVWLIAHVLQWMRFQLGGALSLFSSLFVIFSTLRAQPFTELCRHHNTNCARNISINTYFSKEVLNEVWPMKHLHTLQTFHKWCLLSVCEGSGRWFCKFSRNACTYQVHASNQSHGSRQMVGKPSEHCRKSPAIRVANALQFILHF